MIDANYIVFGVLLSECFDEFIAQFVLKLRIFTQVPYLYEINAFNWFLTILRQIWRENKENNETKLRALTSLKILCDITKTSVSLPF